MEIFSVPLLLEGSCDVSVKWRRGRETGQVYNIDVLGSNLCVMCCLTAAGLLSSSAPGGCGTTFTTQLNILLNTHMHARTQTHFSLIKPQMETFLETNSGIKVKCQRGLKGSTQINLPQSG